VLAAPAVIAVTVVTEVIAVTVVIVATAACTVTRAGFNNNDSNNDSNDQDRHLCGKKFFDSFIIFKAFSNKLQYFHSIHCMARSNVDTFYDLMNFL
jgi:hypothetical protein